MIALVAAAGLLFLVAAGTDAFAEVPAGFAVHATAAFLFCLAVFARFGAASPTANPWVQPAVLLTTLFCIRYGLGALVVYHYDDLPWQALPYLRDSFLRDGVKANLPSACQMFLLADLGLLLGTALPVGFTDFLPALRWRTNTQNLQRRTLAFVPLSVLVFVAVVPYAPEIVRHILYLVGAFSWLVTVLASYWAFRDRQRVHVKWLCTACLIWLASLPLGLRTGMTGSFLQSGLMIGLGYVMARGRLPWRAMLLGGPLLVVVVMPCLSVYKSASMGVQAGRGGANADGLDVRRVSEATAATISSHGYRYAVEVGVNRLLLRITGADQLCRYIRYYPQVYDYEHGASLIAAGAALVPRLLWPEKPNLSALMDAYAVKIKVLAAVDAGTSMNIDAISEYYINFGLAGVFLLSVLHGAYLTVLYRWLVRRSDYQLGASIFLVLFASNMEFFGVAQIAVAQSRNLLLWPLLLYAMSRASAKRGGDTRGSQ